MVDESLTTPLAMRIPPHLFLRWSIILCPPQHVLSLYGSLRNLTHDARQLCGHPSLHILVAVDLTQSADHKASMNHFFVRGRFVLVSLSSVAKTGLKFVDHREDRLRRFPKRAMYRPTFVDHRDRVCGGLRSVDVSPRWRNIRRPL